MCRFDFHLFLRAQVVWRQIKRLLIVLPLYDWQIESKNVHLPFLCLLKLVVVGHVVAIFYVSIRGAIFYFIATSIYVFIGLVAFNLITTLVNIFSFNRFLKGKFITRRSVRTAGLSAKLQVNDRFRPFKSRLTTLACESGVPSRQPSGLAGMFFFSLLDSFVCEISIFPFHSHPYVLPFLLSHFFLTLLST